MKENERNVLFMTVSLEFHRKIDQIDKYKIGGFIAFDVIMQKPYSIYSLGSVGMLSWKSTGFKGERET